MKNKYRVLLDKMSKFNAWEKAYNRAVPVEKRIEQFVNLFDLGRYLPAGVVERAHEEHVKHLIDVKKRLKESIKIRERRR